MRVGILGSGLMGGKLGAIFARAGHEVVFSYARSQDKLHKLAREAGAKARAGTPREAAQDADAILLAVHWLRIDDVLKQIGDLSGKALRIAHMGHINAPMILGTLGVIEVGLNALSIPHGKGGTEAAIDWLGESVSA